MILKYLKNPVAAPDPVYFTSALQRQMQLTKPRGSLGILEKIACRLAAMQATKTPAMTAIHVTVFAADHGITEENVSAFPQSVTAAMVENFVAGGAAINVLCQQLDARLEIVDVGVIDAEPHRQVFVAKAGPGTANFLHQPAMTEAQLTLALQAGKDAIQRAQALPMHLFIGGEMGIGNTTSASAVAAALTGISVESLTGQGTGLDHEGILHKQNIIKQALQKHHDSLTTPLQILQHLGGFEIAALVAAYITATQTGIPVLVDGFISLVAALTAININPQVKPWFLFSHRSSEPGHQRILDLLGVTALLDLDLRLGEASGAAIAVPVLQAACALHNGMATFEQAQVAEAME